MHVPFALEGLVSPVFICVNFDGSLNAAPTVEKVEVVEAPFKLSLGEEIVLVLLLIKALQKTMSKYSMVQDRRRVFTNLAQMA